MYKRKSKISAILVSQPEKPTLKLCVEKFGDSVSYSVMTEYEAYGSPEDVRALEVMNAYGHLLDCQHVPHEKMYRNRFHDCSSSDKVVDRIRVDADFQPPVICQDDMANKGETMFEGKVKRSVMLVPDGQSPTLTLGVEKWDDCRVLSVLTDVKEYGSPEDVLALEVMKAYGDLLDGRGAPHQKMYRRRLNDRGVRDKVVDRIRVDAVRLPPGN